MFKFMFCVIFYFHTYYLSKTFFSFLIVIVAMVRKRDDRLWEKGGISVASIRAKS